MATEQPASVALEIATHNGGTLSEIIHKAALLRRLNLPAELIPTILDLAECYYRIPGAKTSESEHIQVTRNESGTVWLATSLPPLVRPSCLRRIIFTTVSHDQGYSWDHSNHGTYNGSWTWFGAAIIDEHSPHRQEGKRIITNVHAQANSRMHWMVWDYCDDDAEIQEAFIALRAGKRIGITVCAAFPAWVNYALLATIDFDIQPIRRM